jgi:hypothetical protein
MARSCADKGEASCARDDRRCERAQIAKTQPQNGRAHVGDRAARGIEGGRVGERDDLCRQQRFGLDQARRLVDVAIGIVERMLQFERDQRIGREVDSPCSSSAAIFFRMSYRCMAVFKPRR